MFWHSLFIKLVCWRQRVFTFQCVLHAHPCHPCWFDNPITMWCKSQLLIVHFVAWCQIVILLSVSVKCTWLKTYTWLRSISIIIRFSSAQLLKPDFRISTYKAFLSALDKLRKSTTSFVISVFPYVGMEQLDPPTGRIFMKFYTWVFLEKCQKIQI